MILCHGIELNQSNFSLVRIHLFVFQMPIMYGVHRRSHSEPTLRLSIPQLTRSFIAFSSSIHLNYFLSSDLLTPRHDATASRHTRRRPNSINADAENGMRTEAFPSKSKCLACNFSFLFINK